jgi:hypothetical protein
LSASTKKQMCEYQEKAAECADKVRKGWLQICRLNKNGVSENKTIQSVIRTGNLMWSTSPEQILSVRIKQKRTLAVVQWITNF